MKHRSNKGIANIWMVLVALAVIAFMGLVIDVSFVLLSASQLQAAADAASLAGAYKVRTPDEARLAAAAIALANKAAGKPVELTLNEANLPAGEIVIGRYVRGQRLFTPRTDYPNAVKVVAQRRTWAHGAVPLLFGPIAGVKETDVGRNAIAMRGGARGFGIIILNKDRTPRAFHVYGNSVCHCIDGNIIVNSSDRRATVLQGDAKIIADELYCYGGYDQIGNSGELLTDSGGYNYHDQVDDPLAERLEPVTPTPQTWGQDLSQIQALHSITSNVTAPPPGVPRTGVYYYSKGINMSTGSLTLEPGLYVLDGVGSDSVGGLKITGGDLSAIGVTLFIVDSSPNDKSDSHVSLTGNGQVTITPPLDGPTAGVAIWQDKNNTNSGRILGTDCLRITGALYFPSAHMELSGTGDGLGNRLICDTLTVSGRSAVSVDYDGSDGDTSRVFIVE